CGFFPPPKPDYVGGNLIQDKEHVVVDVKFAVELVGPSFGSLEEPVAFANIYALDSSEPQDKGDNEGLCRGTTELGRILEPGYLGSGGQWDMMRPQKGSISGEPSSGSSMYQLNSKPTGPTSNFYSPGLESTPQLCNENRVLREENQRLQAQLSHASREHSQETECLTEALLTSRSRLQELEVERERQKVERQQLLEDLKEKQQEILHFEEERLSLQEKDSRLQHKLALLQHQCEEKQQLFQSLQSELQIYETLYGNSKKGLKGMFSLLPHPMSFLLLLRVLVKSLPWELWRSWKPILLCLRKKTSVIEDPNKKRGELSHTKPRGHILKNRPQESNYTHLHGLRQVNQSPDYTVIQKKIHRTVLVISSFENVLNYIETGYEWKSDISITAYTWDACHQVPLSSDLSHLVAEIRALRGQLEHSIQVNNCLRLQLEQQLDGGASKTSLSPSSVNQKFPTNTDPGNKQLLFQVRDVGMNSPILVFPSSSPTAHGSETTTFNRTNELGLDASPVMKNPPKLEGDATDGSFANKHGRHVIGHIDDYSALRQQIGEGRLLVKKIASLMRSTCNFPGLEAPGTEVMGSEGIHELRNSASALHHRLEEAASLLTMFWRAALPSSHGPALDSK
ncbi:hypothetical protein EI555_009390, partial [Monodon monoceros]